MEKKGKREREREREGERERLCTRRRKDKRQRGKERGSLVGSVAIVMACAMVPMCHPPFQAPRLPLAPLPLPPPQAAEASGTLRC